MLRDVYTQQHLSFLKKTTENTVFQVLLGAPDLMRGAMNFRGLKISRLINHNQLG